MKMMNNMPPYGMFPPMTGPNNMPWQDNNPRMNERINNLGNQVNRIERQLRRMDQRLNQIENSMITPLSSQNTGYGNNGNKYMM